MYDQVEAELKKIFNGRYSTSVSTRTIYSRGEDTYDPVLSKAVVFPETNEEVSKILKLCNEHKIPVVPFGTGTSLEGNVVGNEKGITICLEKMNKILSVNAEDFDCRVQACVTKEQLNEYLREDGVFFPIDPGANAASAPGSIGKKTPSSLKYSFNCFRVTFACTLQSKSSAFTERTLFIFSKEIVIPFELPTAFPSKDVPVPKGTTGILLSLHIFNILDTSSLVSGKTTACERTGS